MSVTLATLSDRVRNFLRDTNDFDQLTASLDASSTTVTVLDSTDFYRTRWPIEVDHETMMIRSIPTSFSLSVTRGWRGSAAAVHASGAGVMIRPEFYAQEIIDSINAAIGMCFPYLYYPVVDTSLVALSSQYQYVIPNVPGSAGFPIPRIYHVDFLVPGSLTFTTVRRWELRRGTVTTASPSTSGSTGISSTYPIIQFHSLPAPGGTIRLHGFGPFPQLVNLTDSLDPLFPPQCAHLIPRIAAGYLLQSGEAGRDRSDTGPVDRREEANRGGLSLSTAMNVLGRTELELLRNAMSPMPPHVRAVIEMAAGSFTAADIPGRVDVVIAGYGYQLLDTIEPSIPFRSHRAIYSYSPTFIERSNVSGGYGDNQQDFWLTASQNDWGLGEQQRYFRQADAASKRRYWAGSNVNVTYLQGQASIESAPNQMSLSFSAITTVPHHEAATAMIGASKLCTTDEVGANAALSHGASFTTATAACSDGHLLYFADASKIRTWDNVSFATFTSTTGSSVLAFSNNTLFGALGNTLSWFDSAGNANLVFAWKSADGTSGGTSATPVLMTPYGGQVMVVVDWGPYNELWLADTTGAQRISGLPNNFSPYDITVSEDIVFIGGNLLARLGPGTQFNVPAIFYYANGNPGKLWQSKNTTGFGTTGVSVAPGRGGVMFNDPSNGTINFYNISDGGVSTVASYTENTGTRLAGSDKYLASTSNASTAYSYFAETATPAASSATVKTSLFDFDSSLTKIFRGVTVDWANAVSGDSGGTVDLAYQLNDVTGTYTSLANSVTAGTETLFPTSVVGNSVSVQVTLNKGSSSSGPALRKISVRAAPEQQTFRLREYVLDLSGIGFKDPVQLNDGTVHPLSGHEQATNLMAAITAKTATTVSDRFGTFTAIVEPTSEIYEVREGNDSVQFSGGFVAKVDVREI